MVQSGDMQVSIIGGGISGLVLGRCLLKRGVQAVIFEKSVQSQNRNNYGITLQERAFRPLLRILDLDEDAFRKSVAVDAAVGGVGNIAGEKAAFRANRNRFEGLLAEGLDVRWESGLESLRVSQGGRLLMMFEGENAPVESPIVVGADGPHSTTRQSIAADAQLSVLPFAVYNGKLRLSADEFRNLFAESMAKTNILEQKIDNAVFSISISKSSADEIDISYAYSRSAKRNGEDALYRPNRAKSEAKNIPDELFLELEASKDRLRAPFTSIFDPQAMRQRNDRLLNWLMRTVQIEDEEQLETAADKGIVLMGDAVHAEPFLSGTGYGANDAIEDGMQLAEIIAEHKASDLRKFYALRKSAWKKSLDDSLVRMAEKHEVARSSI